MTVFEMARHYYPKLWDIGRIDQLYTAGKLSDEKYEQITGKQYGTGKGEV
ncbi:XkdX family protein [Intestinibacillus sp. NTUH-41-i26]|nr:XkdX family protein [Intestinibacillus sp. NTUH-41-i26]WOC74818.1 XkdX family protein [Intestinibacillus sp. NTUH-41-i26]